MKSRTLMALLVVIGIWGAADADAAGIRVVVNESNTTTSMSRQKLAKLFLKKTTKWDDGVQAAPVYQTENAEAHAVFAKSVIGKSVSALKAYWQQKLFSGRDVPPPVMSSDKDVVEYVKNTPGALGYVSASITLDGVKELEILDE